jgi:hypothetical protein
MCYVLLTLDLMLLNLGFIMLVSDLAFGRRMLFSLWRVICV